MGPVYSIAASVYFGPLCGISFAMYWLIAIASKTMGSLSDITRFMELSKSEVNKCKMYTVAMLLNVTCPAGQTSPKRYLPGRAGKSKRLPGRVNV